MLLILLPHLATAQGGKWVADPYRPSVGQDSTLCKNLQERLNSFQWADDRCYTNVVLTYPGFSQPPWETLDPREHVELIAHLIAYWQGGADNYFRRHAGGRLPPVTAAGSRSRADELIAGGGQLVMWRTRLFDYYANVTVPAPPGEQVIVEMRQPQLGEEKYHICPGKPHPRWRGNTFVVTSDLSGPDPHVDVGTASLLSSGVVQIYQGAFFLVTADGEVVRLPTTRGLPDAWPVRYCAFKFESGEKQ
jgi:hypothetical protein